MSLFNIPAAALNIRDKGAKISEATLGLSATDLAICSFCLLSLKKSNDFTMKKLTNLKIDMKKMFKFTSLFVFLVFVINIAYSAMIIKYYSEDMVIDEMMYNFSIAMIVINIIAILLGHVILFTFVRKLQVQMKQVQPSTGVSDAIKT